MCTLQLGFGSSAYGVANKMGVASEQSVFTEKLQKEFHLKQNRNIRNKYFTCKNQCPLNCAATCAYMLLRDAVQVATSHDARMYSLYMCSLAVALPGM